MPKRHNAKLCAFPIRQQIVNALASGDSKRAIARSLRVSNNTVTAIAEQEWQQVEARKAIIAAQAERIANLAADRLNAKLESDDDIPVSALVPVFGVAVDKLAILRGEPSLTIQHQHSHTHHHELVERFNAAMERLEKRAKAAAIDAEPVTSLPLGDASVAAEERRVKRLSSPQVT